MSTVRSLILNRQKWMTWFPVSRKPSSWSRCVVLTAISVLYMLCFLEFIFQWYFLDWCIVFNGETRDSMFWTSVSGPLWLITINEFLQNFAFIISDGLLVGCPWEIDNTLHALIEFSTDLEMLSSMGTVGQGYFGPIIALGWNVWYVQCPAWVMYLTPFYSSVRHRYNIESIDPRN